MIAKGAGVHSHRLACLVFDADALLPVTKLARQGAVGHRAWFRRGSRRCPGTAMESRPANACWARMVSAALGLSRMSCSLATLEFAKRRQGQPELPSIIGLKGSSQASPARARVFISKMTMWRTIGFLNAS
jgi:hypothetical protein